MGNPFRPNIPPSASKPNTNSSEGGTDAINNPSAPAEGGEIIPDEVDLHSTLPTQTAIKSGGFVVCHPKSSIERRGAIQFRIVSGDNEFIDPFNTFIDIKCRILDHNDDVIPDIGAGGRYNPEQNAILVNGITYAAFKQITVKLNNQKISWTGDLYQYRGDLETRLSYGTDVKKGSLALSGFDEEHTAFESINPGDLAFQQAANNPPNHKALMRRFLKTKQRTGHFIGKIHSEIFDQPKLLPPNSVLDIIFERSSDEFQILSKRNNNYRLKIDECRIWARIIDMDEEITRDITRITVAGTSILYPVRRVKMTYYHVAAGVNDLGKTDVLLGEGGILPRRIFVVIVRQEAFHNGDIRFDPFNYRHCHLQTIGLKTGTKELPFPLLECNVETNEIEEPLFSLLISSGALFSGSDLGLTPTNYIFRNFIIGFDLTGSLSAPGTSFEMTKEQNLSLILKTRQALAHVMNVIIYAEYDAEIELLNNRMVICHDYA